MIAMSTRIRNHTGTKPWREDSPGVSTKENAGAGGATSPTGHELDALDCDCMMVMDDCDVDSNLQPHRHQTWAGGLPGVSTKENAGAGGATSPTSHELDALYRD